jgi:hypothetical protein
MGAQASLSTLAGALCSGPIALAVLGMTHPQPAWAGVEAFVSAYHPIQALPFFLGFLLVGGFVALMGSLHSIARDDHKPRTATALVFTAAFSALVFLNYVIQTTFVPALSTNFDASNAPIIAALTMSNPKSLGWGLEMWGYGLLGVATWLAAPVFDGSRLERAASWAFAMNGPVSILPAIWTAFDPGWELSALGMLSFGAWNMLVIIMSVLAFIAFRRRTTSVANG